MLAIQPGAPPQPQQNVEAPTLEEEKLCAGCETSVSSDTGGVVVAFGQSLWHVDWYARGSNFLLFRDKITQLSSTCSSQLQVCKVRESSQRESPLSVTKFFSPIFVAR